MSDIQTIADSNATDLCNDKCANDCCKYAQRLLASSLSDIPGGSKFLSARPWGCHGSCSNGSTSQRISHTSSYSQASDKSSLIKAELHTYTCKTHNTTHDAWTVQVCIDVTWTTHKQMQSTQHNELCFDITYTTTCMCAIHNADTEAHKQSTSHTTHRYVVLSASAMSSFEG